MTTLLAPWWNCYVTGVLIIILISLAHGHGPEFTGRSDEQTGTSQFNSDQARVVPQVSTRGVFATQEGSFDIDDKISRQWRLLTNMCNKRNFSTCNGVDKKVWTHAVHTQFSPVNFNGLGQWSTFKFVTFNVNKEQRTKGGDSWYLVLREYNQRLRVPVRVFDEGDGTYTAAVHFLHPGSYSIWGWLWYSDCHGLQEPDKPLDTYYTPLLKKSDHCYIGARLRMNSTFLIPSGRADGSGTHPAAACVASGICSASSTLPALAPGMPGYIWRMETYYYRKNHTMVPASCCKHKLPPSSLPTSRFLFFGDSTVKNSWELITYAARRPCNVTWKPRHLHDLFSPDVCPPLPSLEEMDPELNKVLKRCTAGAPWSTVPIGTNTIDVSKYHKMSLLFDLDNFTYNDTFARNHKPAIPLPLPREFTFVYMNGGGALPFVVLQPQLQQVRSGDVLVINMGAHHTRTWMYKDWVELIDQFAAAAKTVIAKTGAVIVWRTSFLMKEHVFRSYKHADGYVPQAHFNTDARRLLFDSYAEHVLRPAGVHIWDVLGMTAMGDFKPHDMVHADAASCWAQNFDMMDLVGLGTSCQELIFVTAELPRVF